MRFLYTKAICGTIPSNASRAPALKNGLCFRDRVLSKVMCRHHAVSVSLETGEKFCSISEIEVMALLNGWYIISHWI